MDKLQYNSHNKAGNEPYTNTGLSITGIVGSPRKGANTEALVDSVLNGCRSKGASVSKIFLNELDIRPCQACRVQDGKGCRFHDGMDVLRQAFENSDGIVLGIPVYYSLMSSQIKLMIDRSYCFAERVEHPSGKVDFITSIKKRKKGLMICVSNSYQNRQGISDCVGSWSNEVNLDIIKDIYISHNETGVEAGKSEDVLKSMFRYGEQLCDSILGI